MYDLQRAFHEYLLRLIIGWVLSQRYSGKVRVDEEEVIAVLPHGQLTRRGAGAYFTPKQANKLPRRGERLNIITVGGINYIGALGDTRKRRPALRPMSRGGGVPVPPLPHQPFMSLSVIQRGKDGLPTFAGTHPPGYLVPLPEYWPDENGPLPPRFLDTDAAQESPMFEVSWEQYFAAPTEVQKLWQSALTREEGPVVERADYPLLWQHQPSERPYAAGFDAGGLYIASWERYAYWEGGSEYVEDGPPPDRSYTITAGPTTHYEIDLDGELKVTLQRDEVDFGGFTAQVVSDTVDQIIRAYKYRFEGVEEIYTTNPDTGEQESLTVTLRRPRYRVTGTLAEPYLRVERGEQLGNSGIYPWYIEQVYAGISPAFFYRVTGGEASYGVAAFGIVNVNYWRGQTTGDLPDPANFPPPPLEEGEPPYDYNHIEPISMTQSGYTDYQASGFGVIQTDPPDNPDPQGVSGAFTSTLYKSYPEGKVVLPEEGEIGFIGQEAFGPLPQEEKAKVPFADGWPDVPTEESRAEVARLNPWIYYSAAEPGPHGYLANPHGLEGVESLWCGLSWSSLEYVCDAFYGDELDAETGELVTKLYGVVVLREDEEVVVRVSADGEEVGQWSLWDFFPGAEGELSYLDGETWDGVLRQHYAFAHPQYPFQEVAYLAPFRARLRHKEDKAGQFFTPEAALAPITLYFDSFANRYDPEPPDLYREFRPLDAHLARVTAITGMDAAQLERLTAPFLPLEKPKAITTLESFSVQVDLSRVLLPRRFRVRAYIYVKAGAELAPQSYDPLPQPLKGKLHRLTPDVTGATEDFSREDFTNPAELTVTLPRALPVCRVHVEVRGLKGDDEPLWFGGGGT